MACKFIALMCVAMCFSSALGSPTETREGKQLLLVPLDAMGAYSSHPELPYNFPVPIEAEEYQGRSAASASTASRSSSSDYERSDDERERCPKPAPLAVITSCGNGLGTVVSASPRGIISYYVNNPAATVPYPPAPGSSGPTSTTDAGGVSSFGATAKNSPFYSANMFYNPNVNCTYGIAADPPNTKLKLKCLNISPHIKLTASKGDGSPLISVAPNMEVFSDNYYLTINADLSNGVGYFPFGSNHPISGGFTCIWSSLPY